MRGTIRVECAACLYNDAWNIGDYRHTLDPFCRATGAYWLFILGSALAAPAATERALNIVRRQREAIDGYPYAQMVCEISDARQRWFYIPQ